MSLLNSILEQGNDPEILISKLKQEDLFKDVQDLGDLLPILTKNQLDYIWDKIPRNRKRTILLAFCIRMRSWLSGEIEKK